MRTGAWLTRARVRLWSVAVVIAAVAGLGFLLATAHGIADFRNRPLGTDFAGFYAAGRAVLAGDPAAPYDPARQRAGEQAIFGSDTPFYSFSYPPFFLFIAAALAALPYRLALALWQGASLALYLLAMRAVLQSAPEAAKDWRPGADRLWLLPALAFPAVFINLGHGQNGLVTAALVGGALALLDARPIVAGVLVGLLAYKPQFGLMIPLALAAGGCWRAIAAAVATVALLVLATLAVFGPDAWHAFLGANEFMRVVLLESGAGGWHKMQSVFAWARLWGGSVALAYAIQGTVTLALAATLIWLWRGAVPFALKAAALCLGVLLGTPFSFDYDLMVLAPAIAFLAIHGGANGFGPYGKTALAALWMVPLLARPVAGALLIPLAVPAMLTVYALVLRDAARARAAEPSAAARSAAAR
ncbi:MAG TPA: glycosyltransferase family 87 protein [Xanthobacteraceae bacterium]|nr:glycosyltransferase family 87 protein [Xanthobacteraceae bacterium]